MWPWTKRKKKVADNELLLTMKPELLADLRWYAEHQGASLDEFVSFAVRSAMPSNISILRLDEDETRKAPQEAAPKQADSKEVLDARAALRRAVAGGGETMAAPPVSGTPAANGSHQSVGLAELPASLLAISQMSGEVLPPPIRKQLEETKKVDVSEKPQGPLVPVFTPPPPVHAGLALRTPPAKAAPATKPVAPPVPKKPETKQDSKKPLRQLPHSCVHHAAGGLCEHPVQKGATCTWPAGFADQCAIFSALRR